MFKKFIFCFFCFCLFQLFAIPKGKNVVSGDARDVFQSDQNLLKISTSDKAVIHWDSFSIENFEKVVFDMPNQNSAVLNRVVGRLKSSILGELQANGNVFLINPQGILIGKDAFIDVNSFLASTFDVLDEKFLNNNEMLFSGNSKEKIVNLGTIKASDGDVILLGRIVENSGVLESSSGDVCIGVGREIILKPMDKERIYIKPILEEEKENIGIENSGEILAKNVEMKADGNLYSLAIKNSGHVDAYSLVERDGKILLEAIDGRVETDGSLVAKREGGGEIHVLGKEVGLLNEAYLDASSDTGGGEILIGGDYKGENESIYNAKAVVVFPNALIKANANEDGDGGKVIFWGNEVIDFHGSAFAKGGEVKGDGGFIEISSGGDYFGYFGKADASAYNGKSGRILFDPIDIVIKSATSNPPYNPSHNINWPNYQPNKDATLSVSELAATLNTGTAVEVITDTGGTISLENNLTAKGNLTLKAPQGTIIIRKKYTILPGTSPLVYQAALIAEGGGIFITTDGSNAGILAQGDNSIFIFSDILNVNSNTSNSASIESTNEYIDITTNELKVFSSWGNAFIKTSNGGEIQINKNITGKRGFTIESSDVPPITGFAAIRTDKGGDITCKFLGNSSINANGSVGSYAGIFSGYTLGNGDIDIQSGNLVIESGDSGASSIGGIFSGWGGGSGNIDFNVNNLSITSRDAIAGIVVPLTGGNIAGAVVNSMNLTSNNAETHIRAVNGEIDITNVGALTMSAGAFDCYISCSDSLRMEGVDSITMNPIGSATFIKTTGGGAIDINSSSSPGSGGISLNPNFNDFASYIASDTGGNVDVHFSGDSFFRAGNSDCGIFSARTSGSGTVNFSSGDLVIRGAAGGVAPKAGIYAALGGAGAGDVIFNVGHLTLIGGAAGVAVIQSEKGDVKDSSASSIGLTSNAAEAAIIAPNGNVKIDRAGAVSLTAAGADDCFIFGKNSLEMQGVTSITMNSTSAETFIATDFAGANITINSLSSPGSGGINLSGTNFVSFIETLKGGNIDVHFSGDSSFTAGNSDCGIFSARSSGSGSVNFSSGDLTITGASGGVGVRAGIYSEIGGAGSGDVTFNVKNLTLIGGAAGGATIFSANGDINGFATSMSLTSNEEQAAIITQTGSINMDNAGAVILTAAGPSNCAILSQSSLNMQGVDSITMFPVASNTFIITISNGANLTINDLSSPGSGGINLNPDSSNFLSYIATDKGGSIDINFLGTSSFTAGNFNSGIFSGWTSGNGFINFSSGDLTVTGGTGSGTSLAGIFSGYQSKTFAGSGDIFMYVGDLTLQAGSGSGGADKHNAEIRAGSGSGLVFINASGEVNLFGGEGANCSSYIRGGSAAPGLVDIIASKILLNSHDSYDTSEAAIMSTNGVVDITTDSDVYVKANAAPAYIESLNTMYCGNDLILEANNEEAYINAVEGSTPIIDVADDLKLIAIGAYATINISAPDVLFNVGEDLILSAENSTGVFGASIDGANATFNVGRNVELFGNDNTFAGFAEIFFEYSISINAGRVELQGGNSTVSGAFAAIESSDGNLNITTNFGGMDLVGGRYLGSDAYIKASSGVMNLYVQGTLDMQATQAGESFIEANSFSGFFVNRTLSMLGSDDNAYIKSLSGALNITAGENIFLNGNARVENSTGPLSLIAGNNMYIRNLSIVKNTGGEDLTLVVDNDYPVSPERGHGHFIFEGNSTIEDGKVRIFTVERDFDTISGNINGEPYVPGIEFDDSNQERWGVYYPNSFFGGPGFTIFYKNNGESHHDKGLELVAFASAELFYRLNNMKVDFDILNLYDRYIKRSKKYLVDYLYNNRKNEKNKLSRLNLR